MGAKDHGARGRGAIRPGRRAGRRRASSRPSAMTFLGRPRSRRRKPPREVDRYSLAAMFILAALCLLAGILPGLVIDALSPITIDVLGGRMPIQANEAWLSIVPIAESRSSYNGLLVMVFITISASLAVVRHSSFRLPCAAAGAGLGLRLFRSDPGSPVFRAKASLSRSVAFSARSCSTPAITSRCRHPEI